ncbi:MAG: alpha/beta fold hydrolase [Bacteroidota bacterium]
MKWAILIFMSLLFLFRGTDEKRFSGHLEISNTLFSYYAEGEGIPCITLSGSENIGINLFPEQFLKHFNLIHADANQIKDNQIKDITLDDIAADFEKVRKYLGTDKIAVLGHSMFSILPLEYALRYPDNISYAISTGAIPFFTEEFSSAADEYWQNEASEERKEILNKNIEEFNKIDKSSLPADEVFIQNYIAYTPYRFKDPKYNMDGLWDGVKINMKFVNHYWGNLLNNLDNTEKYKTIESPVLVITGKYDYGCPYYLWNDLDNEMTNLKLVVFENAGHNPMLETPKKFTNTVVNWTENQKIKLSESE